VQLILWWLVNKLLDNAHVNVLAAPGTRRS
jgi:hypothetical protein